MNDRSSSCNRQTSLGPANAISSPESLAGAMLVQDVLDVLSGRRPLRKSERLQDLAFALRLERGQTITPTVANKLLVRLQTQDPAIEI